MIFDFFPNWVPRETCGGKILPIFRFARNLAQKKRQMHVSRGTPAFLKITFQLHRNPTVLLNNYVVTGTKLKTKKGKNLVHAYGLPCTFMQSLFAIYVCTGTLYNWCAINCLNSSKSNDPSWLSSYSLNKSRTCKKTQCSSQDRTNTNGRGRSVNAQMK